MRKNWKILRDDNFFSPLCQPPILIFHSKASFAQQMRKTNFSSFKQCYDFCARKYFPENKKSSNSSEKEHTFTTAKIKLNWKEKTFSQVFPKLDFFLTAQCPSWTKTTQSKILLGLNSVRYLIHSSLLLSSPAHKIMGICAGRISLSFKTMLFTIFKNNQL